MTPHSRPRNKPLQNPTGKKYEMKRLMTDAFQAARSYLLTHGRPIDQAMFRYRFEAGPAQAVSEALKPFANSDGGFGHAIEPDLRNHASSALATSVALQYARLAGLSFQNPLLAKTISYLLGTAKPHQPSGGMGWLIISDAIRTSNIPSAPWWSRTLSDGERSDLLNPSAEMLGYLIEAQQAGHEDTRLDETIASITRMVLHDIDKRDDTLDGHDLLCCMRLLKTPGLPADLQQAVTDRLIRDAPQAMLTDPAMWGAYGLMPLSLFPEPDDDLAATLGQPLIDANLDYEIDRQQPNGSWQPFWDWGPNNAAWDKAKAEWSSELTLKTLMTLRAYGRL